MGALSPKGTIPGPDRGGPSGRRRPPRGDPAPPDLHERLRDIRRPGARLAEGPTREYGRPPRRDRPAVRRSSQPAGGRAGGPQWTEEHRPGPRRLGLLASAGGGWAAGLDRPRHRGALRPVAVRTA